jgi:thiol-disulfide isomerase/thioredoxin
MIDFIVEESLNFSIEVDNSDLANIIAFNNSRENDLYKKLLDTLSPLLIRLTRMDSLMRATAPATREHDEAFQQLISYSEKINQIRTDFTKTNPQHLMTLVFEAQKEIAVPDAPENLNEEEGRMWRFQYYRSRFFDYVRFSDPRIIRTPILFPKIDQFLDHVVFLQADSIITALVWLFEKVKDSEEIFRALLDYTTLKYERANFIGHDAVWAFLVENFYLAGKVDWVSQATLNNFATRLSRVKPWLIGQVPPEMWYPDTSNNQAFEAMTSLFSSSAPYTVIMFWEPNCPHCKNELTRLSNLYSRKEELGFDVITVSRHHDLNMMKSVIAELQLPFLNLYGGAGPGVLRREDVWPVDVVPTIFLLAPDKRIVAKRITVDQIEPFVRSWNARYYSD